MGSGRGWCGDLGRDLHSSTIYIYIHMKKIFADLAFRSCKHTNTCEDFHIQCIYF